MLGVLSNIATGNSPRLPMTYAELTLVVVQGVQVRVASGVSWDELTTMVESAGVMLEVFKCSRSTTTTIS